jgi:hypothetical protein
VQAVHEEAQAVGLKSGDRFDHEIVVLGAGAAASRPAKWAIGTF